MPEAPKPLAPCVFEYVYFARPDTVLDGVSVYRTRLRMGEYLARQILDEWKTHDIDVVVPIPDTARTAALECASVLGLKYREGFMKNRYVGRTFIMPVQGLRKKSVRQKLSAIQSEFNGRNVLLVDDSIVRGTTSTQIIAMAREAGAKKVYIASAAPPVRHPNVYGIDMPTKAELVATARDDDAIAAELGADRVIYQRLDDLKKSVSDEAAEQGRPLPGPRLLVLRRRLRHRLGRRLPHRARPKARRRRRRRAVVRVPPPRPAGGVRRELVSAR